MVTSRFFTLTCSVAAGGGEANSPESSQYLISVFTLCGRGGRGGGVGDGDHSGEEGGEKFSGEPGGSGDEGDYVSHKDFSGGCTGGVDNDSWSSGAVDNGSSGCCTGESDGDSGSLGGEENSDGGVD